MTEEYTVSFLVDNRSRDLKFNIATTLLTVVNHSDVNDTNFIIARFLLDNIDRLSSMSIYSVADECYVSRSSIQRFLKQIGYDSFTSIKESASKFHEHQKSFAASTNIPDYETFLNNQLSTMSYDINAMAEARDLRILANMIKESEKCVFLSADGSSYSIHSFQESMMAFGKFIWLLTGTSDNTVNILNDLGPRDLVVTCSASGNYALAINNTIHELNCRKSLITLNRTPLLANNYNKIYYLSSKITPSNNSHTPIRNVYTRYGMTYFLDLLFHYYYESFKT